MIINIDREVFRLTCWLAPRKGWRYVEGGSPQKPVSPEECAAFSLNLWYSYSRPASFDDAVIQWGGSEADLHAVDDSTWGKDA